MEPWFRAQAVLLNGGTSGPWSTASEQQAHDFTVLSEIRTGFEELQLTILHLGMRPSFSCVLCSAFLLPGLYQGAHNCLNISNETETIHIPQLLLRMEAGTLEQLYLGLPYPKSTLLDQIFFMVKGRPHHGFGLSS